MEQAKVIKKKVVVTTETTTIDLTEQQIAKILLDHFDMVDGVAEFFARDGYLDCCVLKTIKISET